MIHGPESAVVITTPNALGEQRLAAFQERWKATGCTLPLSVHMGVLKPMPPLLACATSHKQALESAKGPVLVFEDDAVFNEHFTVDYNYPKDAEMVYLGGEHLEPPTPAAAPFVRATHIRLQHACIIYDPRAVAASFPEPSMRWEFAFHELGLVTYALERFTVGQAQGKSGITLMSRPVDAYWNYGTGDLKDMVG